MIQIKGNFFDGNTSSRQTAILSVTDTGQVLVHSLENQANLVNYNENLSQLDISPRLGNTPRYLNFESGANFETDENDGVDRLLTQHHQNPNNRFLHILESHLVIVLIFALLVMGFMWGGMKYGIPSMANIIAKHIPVEAIQYLGKGAIDTLDKIAFEPSELSVTRQQELTQLFQSYANNYPEYHIDIKFRKGGEVGANALALPDGTIVFTDEMVDLAENDNELVAIFGHEIGHVVHRHVLRRIIQDSTITVLMLFITGDVSSASSIIVALPSILLDLSYSREFEVEADNFAFDFLINHDLKPDHFAQIMLRLETHNDEVLNELDTEMNKKNETLDKNKAEPNDYDGLLKQVSPYLSTHPATENRIRKFVTKTNEGT